MARSISIIQSAILAAVAADPILSGINSPSSTAIWQKWANIVATAQATEEQLNDQFITNAESILSQNAPGTVAWVQKMLGYFQYSATTPQAIQLDTTTLNPYYPVVDTSLNIISRSAIVTPYVDSTGAIAGHPGMIQIKVATGTVPGALSPTQLSALQSYFNIIKPAGVAYQCFSVPADKLFCNLTVWYNGVYSSTIQNSVFNAYNNFLANLQFNGVLRLSDLEIAIKAVTGVVDVEFLNVNYRRNDTIDSFTPGIYNMVSASTELQPTTGFSFFPFAGYVVDETASGYDFATVNSGNFIAV